MTGPRSEIWYPSWALRVGYVLNEGLRAVVPESVSELTYSMFDVTGTYEYVNVCINIYIYPHIDENVGLKIGG